MKKKIEIWTTPPRSSSAAYYAYRLTDSDTRTNNIVEPVHRFDEISSQAMFSISAEDYEDDPDGFNRWVADNFENTDFAFSADDAITCYHYDLSVVLTAKLA